MSPGSPAALAGTWFLESWTRSEGAEAASAQVFPGAAGVLVYDPLRERVWVQMTAPSMKVHQAYTGRFQILGGHTVRHYEIQGVLHNDRGTSFERDFTVDNDRLTLRWSWNPPSGGEGIACQMIAVWVRAVSF